MTPGNRSGKRRLPFVLALAAVAAGVGGAGAVLWHKVVRHYVVARNFGVVEEGRIYRSGRIKPVIIERLHRKHGLRTIVDLGAYHDGSPQEQAEQEVAERLGITRHRFQLSGDGTGDPNSYLAAVSLMADPANHPLLLHCSAGSERTGTTVILYRHLVQGTPIRDAVPEALEHEHDPGDNWRLLAYMADNLEVMREAYRSGRRIVADDDGRYVIDSP